MRGSLKSDVKQCEKMKLLLSGLLLASLCLSSWSVSSTDTLVLTQTPDVSVREGDTVNITCCFQGMYEKIRFYWWKNHRTEMKIEVVNQIQESHFCSSLTFFNITPKDSGTYICTVTTEIPTYSVISGNGTVISVNKEDGEDDTDHGALPDTSHTGSSWMDVLIFSIRCLPLLVLLIPLFYLNNRLTKAQQHKAAAPDNTSTTAKRGEEDQQEEQREEDRETPL